MAAARSNRPHRNNRPFAQNRQVTHRSFLLDDFRENRYPNLQLNEIVSHVVEFATDHDGSKFIQRKLDDATENRKDAIYREMKENMLALMKDTFGNFVVQKFFDVGTEVQRFELLQLIRTDFLELCMHKYGCRVVQTAIEKSPLPNQIFILQAADNRDFSVLAKNSNGNHVMQKCFRCVPPHLQDYIFNQIKGEIFDLCLDLYGCRVIQCILIHGTVDHRSEICMEITRPPGLMNLIQHRYGNYVIQHALQYGSQSDRNRLVEFIVQNVVVLSQQKYASNVVEKCLNNATLQMKNIILLTICNRKSDDVKLLCIDAYANYVIQKLIESCDQILVENLYERVLPHFREMRRHVCGRKIIDMLEQKFEP